MNFDWYIKKAKNSKYFKQQPVVVHKGSFKPKYLFIGEAPCREAGKTGKPFSGLSGRVLDKWIDYLGHKECGVINVVPLVLTDPDYKKLIPPTKDMMEHYSGLCLELIDTLNPTVCLLLGATTQRALCDKLDDNNGMSFISVKHPSWYYRTGNRNKIPEEIMEVKQFYEIQTKSRISS